MSRANYGHQTGSASVLCSVATYCQCQSALHRCILLLFHNKRIVFRSAGGEISIYQPAHLVSCTATHDTHMVYEQKDTSVQSAIPLTACCDRAERTWMREWHTNHTDVSPEHNAPRRGSGRRRDLATAAPPQTPGRLARSET